MSESIKITRKEYMKDSGNLHHTYYAQFITESTMHFVRERIGIEKLLTSKDKHFNDIIKHSRNGAGGWIWDFTPVNIELMRELGECHKGYLPSQATYTCVGKAAARILILEYLQDNQRDENLINTFEFFK